jgi:hypothetical protein
MGKVLVQTPGNGTPQAEREGHAANADAQGNAPVAGQEAHIDFEANKEQEKHEAEVRNQTQIRHGIFGEDCRGEMGNATKHRRAQKDAANDLGDDPRLAEILERIVENATKYYNYARLV